MALVAPLRRRWVVQDETPQEHRNLLGLGHEHCIHELDEVSDQRFKDVPFFPGERVRGRVGFTPLSFTGSLEEGVGRGSVLRAPQSPTLPRTPPPRAMEYP